MENFVRTMTTFAISFWHIEFVVKSNWIVFNEFQLNYRRIIVRGIKFSLLLWSKVRVQLTEDKCISMQRVWIHLVLRRTRCVVEKLISLKVKMELYFNNLYANFWIQILNFIFSFQQYPKNKISDLLKKFRFGAHVLEKMIIFGFDTKIGRRLSFKIEIAEWND